MTNKEYILGIDVGGTNIRAGFVDENYQLSDFVIESSTQLSEEDSTVGKIVSFIQKMIEGPGKEKLIKAISIGFPSTIDRERKRILSTPNIAGLDNIDMVDELEQLVSIKTYINRDVNMLMLFDMYHENIPDEGVVTGFYLGTGLGNAICIDGHLLRGKNGVAAELGHIPSRNHQQVCGCGNVGCVETFASGKSLREICEKQLNGAFIGDVFTQHKENKAVRAFVRDLAIPIASEITILDPDYIIIGGGLTQMKDFPVEYLEEAIHEFTRKPYPEQSLDFKYSVPGQENGVIGAGIYAIKQLKKNK